MVTNGAGTVVAVVLPVIDERVAVIDEVPLAVL